MNATSITFLREIAIESGMQAQLKLERYYPSVKDTKNISKQSMKLNNSRPKIDVGPQHMRFSLSENF